jgi:multidrug efflux pump subunit AcrA (membrane-fusion protein)
VAFFAVLLAACGGRHEAALTEPTPAPVSLIEVRVTTGPRFTRKTAVLRSRVDLTLAAEASGIVRERLAAEGARVEAGSPVLCLDDAAERSDVAAAEARARDLATSGAQLWTREGADAALARARELLRRRTTRAPQAGILDRYFVDPGEWVVTGSAVARLVDPSRLYLIATVLEGEIVDVDPEGAARITFDAVPGIDFAGRVLRRGQAALDASGHFEVEVALPGDPRLRPGFLANVEIPLRGSQTRMLIPEDATFIRHGARKVFVAASRDGDLVAEERTISSADVPGDPTLLAVVSGLKAGERIIRRGRIGLASGRRIAPTGSPTSGADG